MSKIYKRNCNTCGKYYRGRGEYFCSRMCMPKKDLVKVINNRKIYSKKYYTKNQEILREKSRIYRIENKEKLKKYWAEYHVKNREKKQEYDKKYNKENRVDRNQYVKNKKGIDIQFRLQIALRSRLLRAIKWGWKSGSSVRDLGCTIPELKIYLENQFKSGMMWGNWGIWGWHIDHKIPLSFFDLTDREQFLKAVHYTNLQPMWAIENLKKHDKIPI